MHHHHHGGGGGGDFEITGPMTVGQTTYPDIGVPTGLVPVVTVLATVTTGTAVTTGPSPGTALVLIIVKSRKPLGHCFKNSNLIII